MFLNKEALMIRAHDNASSLIGQKKSLLLRESPNEVFRRNCTEQSFKRCKQPCCLMRFNISPKIEVFRILFGAVYLFEYY